MHSQKWLGANSAYDRQPVIDTGQQVQHAKAARLTRKTRSATGHTTATTWASSSRAINKHDGVSFTQHASTSTLRTRTIHK